MAENLTVDPTIFKLIQLIKNNAVRELKSRVDGVGTVVKSFLEEKTERSSRLK